ncbi:MAG TPA: GNAT family acetyltransferase [Gemmataceae bacterium]|nr:GNAT family acetyltransferase [Gemmataceae bacterium]
MNDLRIRPFEDADEPAVIALWTEEGADNAPHNDAATAIRKKIAVDREQFLVAVTAGTVVGTVMGGYDGHRGWVYAVQVARARRRQGIASALLRHLEGLLVARGCLKVNLQVRAANAGAVALYKGLGYEVEERVSMGKRLY